MRKINRHKSQIALYSSLKWISRICTAVSLVSLLAVVLYVLINGVDKLSIQLLFGEYGKYPSILPAFVGTLELVAVATIIAVPIGVASAIFLVEYTNNKSKIVKYIRVATETLAGIPSIVYGLFGYLVFVVLFGWGYSLLGGGLTLAIMILPVIVRSTEESLLAVPDGFREGAYALGTSKVRTIFKVVLPSASGGIVTAIILAIGRVVSESAVLILTIGMVVNKMPVSVMSPGTSLALDIYYFASYGYPDEAAATAVVLLIFVMILNLLATLVGKLLKKGTGEK
ncbi:MAG: phosphate ABC transporter permease PstA [Clostridia bacterium]|nr:phosphate ABC transporter permease PstA [Clostridia bacterium]